MVVEQYTGNGRKCPSDLVQTKPCYPKGCYRWTISDWSPCMPQVSLWISVLGEICVIFKTHKALSNHKSSLRPCHWYCFFGGWGGGCCCWKRLSSKLNFKPYIFLIYWHLDEKNLYCLDTRYVISFLMSSLKEKHVWCWHSDEECFLFGGWWTARRPREVSSRPWHTCPEGKYIHLDTSIKIRPYNECSFSLVVSLSL